MAEKEEKVATAEVGILTLINSKLRQILEIQKEQIPEGVPVDFPDVAVTETTLIDLINDRPYRPLFRVDIYNGGPNNLYVKVNDCEEVKIKPYRDIPFDYRKASIRKIQLRVETGESATAEIVGLY